MTKKLRELLAMGDVIDMREWQIRRFKKLACQILSIIAETPDDKLTKMGRAIKREMEQ